MKCEWVNENLDLYIYEELADDARHEMQMHLAKCAACAAALEAAKAFHASMSALPAAEPTPNFLAASRMKLQEALEVAEQRPAWQRWIFDPVAFFRQVRFAPALASCIFVVGFAGGIFTTVLTRPPQAPIVGKTPAAAEASIAGIRGITREPDSGKVSISFDRLTPDTTEGTLDDPAIQRLLLFAYRNQYNSGLRVDSVELLSQRCQNDRVREAMIHAMRYDKNPGVRLRAMEGLQAYVRDDVQVRNAVVEALLSDSNPGVRTEAIRILQSVKADSTVRSAFEQLASQDPNQFIRRESQRTLASVPEID